MKWFGHCRVHLSRPKHGLKTDQSLDFRWGKYESKTLFWVEEEISAEWEQLRSRSHRQTYHYNVETPAADAIAETSGAMHLDTNEAREATGLD